MKKITVILTLLLTLSLFAACTGGNGGSTTGNASNNNASPASDSGNNASATSTPATGTPAPSKTPAPASAPQKRVVETPDKPLDLTDDSIYFVVIDGVKINLHDSTVQDFMNIGFVFNEDEDDEDYYDENSEVDANSAADYGYNFGAKMYKEGTRAFIEVYAVNLTNRSLPLKDCEIGTVYFDERIGAAFDISTACNLSYGCTEDEIKSVFGDIADDMLSQTAYERNQIRYFAAGHGEFWFISKDSSSGVFRQVGVHTAKSAVN